MRADRAICLALSLLSGFIIEIALASRSRGLHVRDIPVVRATCNSTIQGRWWIADSNGMLCPRASLRPEDGCCAAGDRFSCATCNLQDRCCEEYEQCVSCCQDPAYAPADLSSISRAPDRPETGHWATTFEYCRNKCRTSSKSTVHENAYLSTFHHCFSPAGKPTTAAPPTPQLPAFAMVVLGSPGESCTTLCETAGRRCSAEHLASLNNCNILREHFACEAGCEADAENKEAPAYVTASAPKQTRPTLCLTADHNAPEFSCDVAAAHTQRLCACMDAER